MSEQDNIRLVQNVYDCFRKGKIDDLVNLHAEDVEWITPGPPDVLLTAGTWRGRKEVANFFAALSTQQDTELFEQEDFIAQGDKVVAISKYRGRVKATGKTAETTLVHVFDIKNGQIQRFREYFDTAAILPAFMTSKAATPK